MINIRATLNFDKPVLFCSISIKGIQVENLT